MRARSDLPCILVVDDEPANIEVLVAALDGQGDVIFARSGEEALLLARRERPDLILLDVLMPGLDGYEVCRRLKAAPETARAPVIFVTALDCLDDEERGLDVGAIDYITKPVRPAIVRARVRNHLDLKRYRDLLENLATTDALTGLGNRRHLDERVEHELRRLRRTADCLSLIMLDVDHFKAYNDAYGHPAGDLCLRKIASVLRSAARRPADVTARYGGEEFACLLPETNHAAALRIAQSLADGVRGLNIRHADSQGGGAVTISLGVSTVACRAETSSADLFRQADERLYAAKEFGRDRVVGDGLPMVGA